MDQFKIEPAVIAQITDIPSQLIIKALLTTDLPLPKIAASLKITKRKIYHVAERYLPRGFLTKRACCLNNNSYLAKLKTDFDASSIPFINDDEPAGDVVQIIDSAPAAAPVPAQTDVPEIDGRDLPVEYSEVERACEAIRARGGEPNCRNIRDFLGGGSFSTIAKYLKIYRHYHCDNTKPMMAEPGDGIPIRISVKFKNLNLNWMAGAGNPGIEAKIIEFVNFMLATQMSGQAQVNGEA